MDGTDGIEHHVLPLRLEVSPAPLPLLGAFTYRCDRPYELALDFRGAGMHVARWVFSRDLLLDGETCATGEGDVQVWPRWQGREPRVFLAFTNGERSCVVSARAKDVRALSPAAGRAGAARRGAAALRPRRRAEHPPAPVGSICSVSFCFGWFGCNHEPAGSVLSSDTGPRLRRIRGTS